MKKLLFVCTGNICRSPTAHAIANHKINNLKLADKIIADSAGTSAFHVGQRPDSRAVEIGLKKNINFNNIRSRKIEKKDFLEYDLIFAMDRSHMSSLRNLCPEEHQDKIQLFLQYANVDNNCDDEVRDPYYGGIDGFVDIFNLIEVTIDNIIADLN